MIYQMTIISSGTRLRKDHNTFAAVITSYNAGQIAEGTEFWIAPADGSEVKKGDKWLKVSKMDGVDVLPGWMAFTHKGVPICKDWREFEQVPLPDPSPVPVFPESYTLIDPSGAKALYTFVKIL